MVYTYWYDNNELPMNLAVSSITVSSRLLNKLDS